MLRICALGLFLLASPVFATGLHIGASSVVITPPLGTPMAGYYSERGAEGVRDDLRATALVLERDGTFTALVSLDLISTTRRMVEESRRLIEKGTGIPGGNVMISATHTHTGPVLATRGPRDDALGGSTDLARRYNEELPGKIALAVQKAKAALTPARAAFALGREDGIAFNRRFHMKDGTVGWNPGILNPRILKPAGGIDPDVPVVYFSTVKGSPLATFLNHAVHLDNVGGTQISADMPATVARLLADVKGSDMVTLYTTGCCGDVNHINVAWSDPQKGPTQAARMGIMLTGAALRAWPRLANAEAAFLRCKSTLVQLPLARLAADDVEKAEATATRFRASKGKGIPFLESVHAFKVLDVNARKGQPHEVEVQVVALGRDIAWVSLPGEIFVELGQAIKQASPFPMTIVSELANGSIGYVPAQRAYAQGNYEVVSARCGEGSGELLVEAAVRLLKELHR